VRLGLIRRVGDHDVDGAVRKPGEPTVRAWIRSGKLRAINPSAGHRPGHTYRISRDALAQFLAGTEQQPPEREVDIPAEAARIVEIVARKRKT
jgi:excisionase family DNA binding protein